MIADKIIYYIVSNKDRVITHGSLASGQELSTKHNITTYDDYSQYVNYCNENDLEAVKKLEEVIPKKINPAQGRIQLTRMNKIDDVKLIMNDLHYDNEIKIMWEWSTEWYYTNPVLQDLAKQIDIDLKEFFIEASKIKA